MKYPPYHITSKVLRWICILPALALAAATPSAVHAATGFDYIKLFDRKNAATIPGETNVYGSQDDTDPAAPGKYIRLVDGPLSVGVDNRAMLKRALEDDRGGGFLPRIVVLKPGVYEISDYLTIRPETTLIGTTDALGNRTIIRLKPSAGCTLFDKTACAGGFTLPYVDVIPVRPVVVTAAYGPVPPGQVEDDLLRNTISTGSGAVSVNNSFRIALRDLNIEMPDTATRAVGLLWRTAQQSFVENVNVTSAINGGNRAYAGMLTQADGGGGYWRNCRIDGTNRGIGGSFAPVLLNMTIANTTGPALYWGGVSTNVVARGLTLENCAHGLIFYYCMGVNIIDSHLNLSSASNVPITHIDNNWNGNLYMQNVDSNCNFLVRKRVFSPPPGEGVTTDPDPYSSFESSRTGDVTLIPRTGGQTRAEHWVSGKGVTKTEGASQMTYNETELPFPSSAFPALDGITAPSSAGTIYFRPVSTPNYDYAADLQAQITAASNANKDLVIMPGTYKCAPISGAGLLLGSKSRIFGIQFPRLEFYPDSTYNSAAAPKAFISTPVGSSTPPEFVILDGLSIGSNDVTYGAGAGSAAGLTLLDWRCPALVANCNIGCSRLSFTSVRFGKYSRGLFLNSWASTSCGGAAMSIYGEDTTGPVDAIAVSSEHGREAEIVLDRCSNFNFLLSQFERTGKLVDNVSDRTWLPDHSDEPRDIELNDCQEIRFFNAVGGRESPHDPGPENPAYASFVVNRCDSIYAFTPRTNFPYTGEGYVRSYFNTAAVTPFDNPAQTWFPTVTQAPALTFPPTFGVPQRRFLAARWTFDQESTSTIYDSVGINDGSGYFSRTADASGLTGHWAIDKATGSTSDILGGNASIFPVDRNLDLTSFTASTRVKVNPNATGFHCLLQYKAADPSMSWEVLMGGTSGTVYAILGNYGAYTNLVATTGAAPYAIIRDGKWHDVTMTYDADTKVASLYCDSVFLGQVTWNRPAGRPVCRELSIGYANTHPSPGAFDDVRVWSYARSAAEVGLSAEWTFNGDTAPNITDGAGINNGAGYFSLTSDGNGGLAIDKATGSASTVIGGSATAYPKDRNLDLTALTASTRVKIPSGALGWRCVLNYEAVTPGHSWEVVTVDGVIYAALGASPYTWISPTTNIPRATLNDGAWHDVKLTCDGASTPTLKLYVDGYLIGQTSAWSRPSGRPVCAAFSIGTRNDHPSPGAFDNVSVRSYVVP